MTRRLFSVMLAASMAAFLFAGCGTPVEAPTTDGDDAPAADAGKTLKIGVMPKLIGIDYFNAAEIGAKEAADALGVEVDYDGPVEPDVTKQVQMIDTWITRKYDAICVAPNDPDAISDVLKKARQRGIKVITWDTDAQADARDFFVNQTTSEGIAHTMMDIMAEGVGPEAKFINITGTLTAANQNTWMKLMEEYRQQTYPGMTNLSETPKESGEDQARATQVCADSLKAYPELEGIFALTSVALPGSAEALRKAGAADKVFLTGLATPKAMKAFIGWLLGAAKGYAAKLVNPGGVEVWKHHQGGNVSGIDSEVDHFGVTPRQIIFNVARAVDKLHLPHSVHLHCNNLGMPGNWRTTLDSMKSFEGHRGHLTHIQFHSYGGGEGDENTFNSKGRPVGRVCELPQEHYR